MSKMTNKAGSAKRRKLYLRPGYSFVIPGTREVITDQVGFTVDADDPRIASQRWKFAEETEARRDGILTEVEIPEVTKTQAPRRDPLKGF